MNWSSDDLADVSPEVVTVTSSMPAPAGAVAVICVADSAVMFAGLVPNSTVDPLVKPVPVMITLVPPTAGPEVGLTPVTVGR